MICNKCNNTVPNDSEYCPFCGNIIEQPKDQNKTVSEVDKGYKCLELKQWKKAAEIFDFAIVNDDSTAKAYIGKLLAKLKLCEFSALASLKTPLSKYDEYNLALKYADDEYMSQLEKLNTLCEEKYAKKKTRAKKGITVSLISFSSLLVILALSYFVFIPFGRYAWYKDLLSDGNVTKVAKSYSNSKWFEYDSKIKKMFYFYGNECIENKEYVNAETILKIIDEYKDSSELLKNIEDSARYEKLCSANVGDYVEFGIYEQDADYSNGEENIEWIVLEKSEDKVLLISKYGLDCVPFSEEYIDDATWETSYLRNWLNNVMYNYAFNSYEQKYIINSTIQNYDYTHEASGTGILEDGTQITLLSSVKVNKNSTNDFLFVLSEEDAEKYFTTSKSRKAKPTEYAKKMGADTHYGDGKHAPWWLRNNPDMNKNHMLVSGKGGISSNSISVDSPTVTVRPAMWVDISEFD